MATTQARRWCFTLNNPSDDQQQGTLELSMHMRGAVYQVERGEQGTLHLQGYVEFTRPMRLGALKTIMPRAHWEPARGTAGQAKAYCTKEESRVNGPFFLGEELGGEQGKRTDLDEAATMIQSGKGLNVVASALPKTYIKYSRGLGELQSALLGPRRLDDSPVAIFTFGPTGSGKTRAADSAAPDAYWKDNSHWWNLYCGQQSVIWDDFRGKSAAYSDVLRLVDRYPMKIQYKGGVVELQAKHWLFTSNQAPWQLWNVKNQDPWYRRLSFIIYKDEDSTRFFNDIRECMMYMGNYEGEEH